MPLSLKLEAGDPVGAVYALKPGETLLGRSSSAGVHLAAPDISGTHARITVTGDSAVLENVSRFGTRVDTEEITGPVTLRPGQRIAVGKTTVLVFQSTASPDVAEASATRGTVFGNPASPATCSLPDDVSGNLATGKGIPVKPRIASDEKTSAAPPGGGDVEPLSRPDWTTESGGEGETRAMQTRAVSPEEIEFLKVSEQKKGRRRIILGLAIALPALVVLILFWPRTLPPEKEFDWPRTAEGEFMDAYEPAPSGGIKEGGFDICFPGTPGFTRKPIAGGIQIECRIGRDFTVPMRIILMEEVDKKFADMTRMDLVNDWIQQLGASGGNWNFDKPSQAVFFIGKENGLAAIRVTYQCDKEGSWFGVATVVRNGIRRISVRAEAPAVERVRAEWVLATPFIQPSVDFLRQYWEPSTLKTTLSEDDAARQVRQELDRMAPGTWGETEQLLRDLLTRAAQRETKELEAEGVGLLAKLREREALWFNSQQLAFDAAVMQGNTKKAGKIAEFCRGVFSNMDDQRYYTVRKWRTEP